MSYDRVTVIIETTVRGDAVRFVLAFAIAFFVALICTNQLKKAPAVFYSLSIAAVAVYVYGISQGPAVGFWGLFIPFMQRCTLAMAFFAIVMFVGVFDENSPVRRKLLPVRRQLSICGCLLCLAHVFYYAKTYLAQLESSPQLHFSGSSGNLILSLAISVILVLLLGILGITSCTIVKAKMKASSWKNVQRLSYAFFTLIIVHLGIILVPPALSGNTPAIESVVVWGLIFVLYAVLKIKREIKLRRTTDAA